jgi:thioredoxin 1
VSDAVKTLTDATFADEIAGATPVVVDFWAPWCGPCRSVGPIIEDLADARSGEIVVGKLNVDENQATAAKYGVMSIPTIVLFRDGEPEKRIVGARPTRTDLERDLGLA